MKKAFLISVVTIMLLCCGWNVFVVRRVDRVSDNLLNECEALARRETATVYRDHVMYTSDDCTIIMTNEDGMEIEIKGVYTYCHEMPNRDCLSGCAI